MCLWTAKASTLGDVQFDLGTLQAMRDSLGSSRGINRHRYSIEEAEQELQRPVVQALLELCRFRNSHPAFNGEVNPFLMQFVLTTYQSEALKGIDNYCLYSKPG